MILLGTAAVQVACSSTAKGPATTPNIASSAIQPMTLRYHGEHRGEHPSWIYTAHASVNAEAHQGRPAWRRSYRFETISPPLPDAKYEGSIVLDRDTLAPLESHSTFGTSQHRWVFHADRVEQTDTEADGKTSHTSTPLGGFVVTDVWMGFDLYVLALPLKPDFRGRVAVLYEDDPPRPFELVVERIERVHVPAGEFETFRIRVDPLDGDDRMRSIYHVRTDAPRLVVRKEYVVNPRTEGELKQSTGIEELEAIEPGQSAKGSARSRLPVSANTALATAGAIGGVPGSPAPPILSVDATIAVSIRGASCMRSTR
jgi:hypothetical protein